MRSHTPPAPLALSLSADSWALRAGLLFAGVAVMTVAAKVKVPFPPVPVTLQTLALPFIAAAFGSRLALATMIAYLAAGFAGLPVFTNTPPLAAGPFYFLGPTGGYLLACPLAAWLIGKIAEGPAGRSLGVLLLVMAAGNALVLSAGFLWFGLVALPAKGFSTAWRLGVEPFLLADFLKAALAALVIHLSWKLRTTVR